MAATSAFEAKLHACISGMSRDEWAASKTSHISQAAETAVSGAIRSMEFLNRELQRGVRSIDFLDLPAELRNRIYEYAVTTSDGRDIKIEMDSWDFEDGLQPTITRVSRQLRRETLHMYYSLNHFTTNVASDDSKSVAELAVEKWLLAIGEENAKQIANLTIVYADYMSRRHGADIQAIMSTRGLASVKEIATLKLRA